MVIINSSVRMKMAGANYQDIWGDKTNDVLYAGRGGVDSPSDLDRGDLWNYGADSEVG